MEEEKGQIVKPIYSPAQKVFQEQNKAESPEVMQVKIEPAETTENEQAERTERSEHKPVPPKVETSSLEPLFPILADYFHLDGQGRALADQQLTDILRWAVAEKGTRDPGEVIRHISMLERELPSAGYGERRHAIVYRYVKLALHKHNIERELETYKKKDGI